MKDLMKIISRYSITAGVAIFVILFSNILVFGYIGYRSITEDEKLSYNGNIRVAMESIGNELSKSKGKEKEGKQTTYKLSKKGKEILKSTNFVWAMALDEQGDVVWKWELPEEIPLKYSLSDVATFSRWYLCDYPVRVWKNKGLLCVYAYPRDSYSVINMYYTINSIKNIPQYIQAFLIANVVVIILFILILSYRFYWSLRPISQGIEALSKKEPIHLRERGIAGNLAKKINITSRILEEQNEKLTKRDQARTEWIAGVSHDIRTPLTLIMGYSERLMNKDIRDIKEQNFDIMEPNISETFQELENSQKENSQRGNSQRENSPKKVSQKEISQNLENFQELKGNQNGEKKEKEQEMAKSIYRQAVIIKQLIEDLNLTSKLTYNATPLDLKECEPAKLLRECIADIYNSGLDEKYEIEISISKEAEKSKILVDEKLIKRAIRNILGNSIRHNKSGCIVRAKLNTENDDIYYTFLDSGPGIPSSVVKILQAESKDERSSSKFDKKRRISKRSMSEGRKKTVTIGQNNPDDLGQSSPKQVHIMGLRLTRQIVEVHGGEFWFCARENGNYDCKIRLPRK